MIEPTNEMYKIPEHLMDGLLIHQKDRLLSWINELEQTRTEDKFIKTYHKVLGSVIILADIWSIMGYSYKAEEISKRLAEMRKSHKLKHLM
jgi:hypothetical protein